MRYKKAMCDLAIVACEVATTQKITARDPNEIIHNVNAAYNKAGLCATKIEIGAFSFDYLSKLDEHIITLSDTYYLSVALGNAMKMTNELTSINVHPQIEDIFADIVRLYPHFNEQEERESEYHDYIMTVDESILTNAERKSRITNDAGYMKLANKIPHLKMRNQGGDPELVKYIQEEKAAGRLTAIPESSS